MGKLHIAIFFGGKSSEYPVSLESAYSVIRNLDQERYVPVPVGISKEGGWFYFTGDIQKIKNDTWMNQEECIPAAISLAGGEGKLLLLQEGEARAIPIDVGFPVLHGRNGEDGTIQGLIELAGIPLAGCGVLASALCMDKHRAHKLAAGEGVLVPRGIVLSGREEKAAEDFAEKIGYPLYVKPVKAGSSLGVTKVARREELPKALALAFLYDSQVMVEENIEGFEVGCAILGKQELLTGEVDEIALSGGFFDFTEKYTLETSQIHVPARIAREKAEEIKKTAKAIYQALGCTGFSRVDMFLDQEGGIVFNEVNTIPGFTEHSRYPGMMKAAGYSFGELLDKIIALALAG